MSVGAMPGYSSYGGLNSTLGNGASIVYQTSTCNACKMPASDDIMQKQTGLKILATRRNFRDVL